MRPPSAPPLPAGAGHTGGSGAVSTSRTRGLTVALLAQGLDEIALVHVRPTLDAELTRPLVQVVLTGVLIDAPGGLPVRSRAFAGVRVLRLGIGRALALLGDPVVTLLLVLVLDRGHGDTVGAFAFAVLLDGAVVRLDPGALRLLRRALERFGQFLLTGHATHPRIRGACQ